ncbi:MAG: hypothetical protein JSR77_08385 [Planctomycetes bacterium]|nr:hypothetical protein [Planctomycetota bacterium]
MLRLTHSVEGPQTVDAHAIPMRIGRAGISAIEPKPAVLHGVGRSRAPQGDNPILAWLKSKAISMREYLEHLARMDANLAEALKDTYSLRHVRRRLALTLFIDFSHEQGLSAGEVAALIGDAQQAAGEAVNYLINAAAEDAGEAIA